jgi:hypothetical protein
MICSTCFIEKQNTEFTFKYKSKGIRHKQCRGCWAKYRKSWYKKNRKKHIQIANKTKEKIANAIRNAKNVPCMDCGIQYPYYVMDFDHVKGPKKFNLHKGTRSGMNKVLQEIAKCEIVCANCHRQRTHSRLRF